MADNIQTDLEHFIGANHELNIYKNRIGWGINPVPLISAKGGTAPPTWAVFQAGIDMWSFAVSVLNEMHLTWVIGHDYAEGTDIIPSIRFSPLTDEVSADVRWGIEYSVMSPDGDFAAPTTVYVDQTVVANAQFAHVEATFAAIAAASTIAPGTIFVARIFRDGVDAADTYAGAVAGISANLHYRKNKFSTYGRVAPFNQAD